MRARILQWALLIAALTVLCVIAGVRQSEQRAQFSFYSTYDTGPNGYRALYEVLTSYGVPVRRFQRELGMLDPDITTLVLSDYTMDQVAGIGEDDIDKGDAKRLRRFVIRGGRLILLMGKVPTTVTDAFATLKSKNYVVIRSPGLWSNGELDHGKNAFLAYRLLANRGPVAFDETVHGYGTGNSMWSVLPEPVHVAVWIVCAMVLMWLIESNIRFVPPTPLTLPDERDSSSYIRSMADLLKRARAGGSAIGRFAEDAQRRSTRQNDERANAGAAELERLAAISAYRSPNDVMVLQAARLAAQLRKDYG